jgi:hypothetical protein
VGSSRGHSNCHVALVATAFAAAVLYSLRVIDSDLGWQIQTGALAWSNGRWLHTDPFTFTHAGGQVPAFCWAAQIILFLAHRWLGWCGVQLVGVVALASAFLLSGWSAVSRAAAATADGEPGTAAISVSSLVVAMVLGMLAALTSATVRPQAFALPCFAVILMAIERPPFTWRTWVVVAVTAVLWQNLHPSVGVALVAWTPVAALRIWRARRDRSRFRREGYGWLLVLATLAASQVLTPDGAGIFASARRNAAISRDLLQVSEWMPAWHPSVWRAMVPFWMAAVLSTGLLVLLAGKRRRLRGEDVVVFVALTSLTLLVSRFVAFWSVAMVPIWARWLELARPPARFRFVPRLVNRAAFLASLTLGGLSLTITFLIIARAGGPRLSPGLTSVALETLKHDVPAGRLFNDHALGATLILDGYPHWQVAFDGRLYLFDHREWIDYGRIGRGEVAVDEVVARYQPAAFVLTPTDQRRFVEQLRVHSGWQQTFLNADVAIFVRQRRP